MVYAVTKRIRHLTRYFGMLGILTFLGYQFIPFGNYLLIFLGPPLIMTEWLRRQPLLTGIIPNQPLFNNLLLLFPITLIYFGCIGFQLKNILNERGKVRLLILAAFLTFIVYIHYLSFQDIGQYLAGSST